MVTHFEGTVRWILLRVECVTIFELFMFIWHIYLKKLTRSIAVHKLVPGVHVMDFLDALVPWVDEYRGSESIPWSILLYLLYMLMHEIELCQNTWTESPCFSKLLHWVNCWCLQEIRSPLSHILAEGLMMNIVARTSHIAWKHWFNFTCLCIQELMKTEASSS